MVSDPLTSINLRTTPQNRPTSPDQVRNAAGGYVYRITPEAQIRRFLTMGTTGGTYYISEADHTAQNAQVLVDFARTEGLRLVELVVEISTAGRAPKQNPGLFALAAVAGLGSNEARKAALAALPSVARTGSTLFQFLTYVRQFRGWGKGLQRGVAAWYTGRPVDRLAYQVIKYRTRNGMSHRDVLRLAHIKGSDDPARKALFNWIATGDVTTSRGQRSANAAGERAVGATREDLPALIGAFEAAQATTDVNEWVRLIGEFGLPWEALPDAARTQREVWEALVTTGMPIGALLRQLPTLTRYGVLAGTDVRRIVIDTITNEELLKRGRIHPVNVLIAARTYARGVSLNGSTNWTPDARIVDALDLAFYRAFGAAEPADKRTLLALDISGSMGAPVLSGVRRGKYGPEALPGALTAREAAAALALVTMSTEPSYDVVGFTGRGGLGGRGFGWGGQTQIQELDLSPRRRLDDAVRYTSNLNFGATDVALPFIWAKNEARDYETVIVYTDNESWAGQVHPHQALRAYRETVGHEVRQIVVALSATQYSVADPNDAGSIDIAGLDGSVPNLIADFSAGRV